MPPAFGLDYLAPVRSFRNFFGRFGTTGGSIRGVFNAIIPVAVVDRYRDDTEGSLFGMTMFAFASAGRFPAFAMGSPVDDWELLSVNFGVLGQIAPPATAVNFMIYTPDSTYVPVQVVNPVGLFWPGLNLDWSFTLSSVSGIGGHNSAPPARWGFIPQESIPLPEPAIGNAFRGPAPRFDPPIRVYRDVTLGFVADVSIGGSMGYAASILYRVRPRTTDGPRTGTP